MSSGAQLPTPADRPDADIVIFDGDCRFCQKQIARLVWWDGGHRLAYLSLHDPGVGQICPELSHDDLMRQMVVVDRDGQRHGGAAAIRYLSRRLPRLWWLAPAMHFPGLMPLWQLLYRIVADRRYRLSGAECDNGACGLHRPGNATNAGAGSRR